MSDRNIPFYERTGPEGLKKLGLAVSIDECFDLESIDDLISDSGVILEIGAGYGRVIKHISDKYPEKRLFGLENCKRMYEYLDANFSTKAELINTGILDAHLEAKPDLMLWMWSGFSDLGKEEQVTALKKLYDLSSDYTRIIIDLPDIRKSLEKGKKGTIGVIKPDDSMEINHPEYGTYVGYIPPEEEMLRMTEESMLDCKNIVRYDLCGSPRIQYRLGRKQLKKLKFTPELSEMIIKGEKTTTWRIDDDKGLKAGDAILLLAHPELEEIAKAEIISAKTTTFGDLSAEDWEGHERFGSAEEMYETYSRYYNVEATPNTRLKVIKFKMV